MQYGALPRQLQQTGFDVGYQDWQNKQAFPWENLNKLKNLSSIIPGQAQFATNESSNYQYNPLMQGAGVAGQVYDAFNSPDKTSSSTPSSSYTPNTSNLSFADSSTGPSYNSSFNSGIAKLPGEPG
jgi:hypothetical protein